MPSKTHDLLATMFRETREKWGTGPFSLEGERAAIRAYEDAYRPVPGVTDEETDGLVPGARLMTPDDARDDVVIVFVHGGGFRVGSAKAVRGIGAQLALGTRARVLLPEYRLAPEHPYPAALDDCEAAFQHALSSFPEAGMVVGGESAGANLAAALLLRRRDAGDARALAGVLYAGVFDLRPENYARGSWVANAETDLILSPASGPIMTADYLAGQTPDDGYVSPALADLRGLPPLFVQVSSAELLLDDSLALVTNAARAGVHVELEVWPHVQHVWQAATGFLPEATEAVDRTVAFIQRVAEGRVVDGAALSGGPASFEEVM
ncbi:alpha/beta hydrolase fold domain-containing protein [Nonomuraea sp. B19D2]|uniref:alpha/beta hydrolase n=1 Tax=Nonomuraea sp. B19D2 TaxID=3159561 RepID=UPI0032DBA502